jgi:hypothetical protein
MCDKVETVEEDRPEDGIKWMDIKEFRAEGYLQEVNRVVLHPFGLGLAVAIDDDGNETLYGVQDFRDDPEGLVYGEDTIDPEKIANVLKIYQERIGPRMERLGFFIQPLEIKGKGE